MLPSMSHWIHQRPVFRFHGEPISSHPGTRMERYTSISTTGRCIRTKQISARSRARIQRGISSWNIRNARIAAGSPNWSAPGVLEYFPGIFDEENSKGVSLLRCLPHSMSMWRKRKRSLPIVSILTCRSSRLNFCGPARN